MIKKRNFRVIVLVMMGICSMAPTCSESTTKEATFTNKNLSIQPLSAPVRPKAWSRPMVIDVGSIAGETPGHQNIKLIAANTTDALSEDPMAILSNGVGKFLVFYNRTGSRAENQINFFVWDHSLSPLTKLDSGFLASTVSVLPSVIQNSQGHLFFFGITAPGIVSGSPPPPPTTGPPCLYSTRQVRGSTLWSPYEQIGGCIAGTIYSIAFTASPQGNVVVVWQRAATASSAGSVFYNIFRPNLGWSLGQTGMPWHVTTDAGQVRSVGIAMTIGQDGNGFGVYSYLGATNSHLRLVPWVGSESRFNNDPAATTNFTGIYDHPKLMIDEEGIPTIVATQRIRTAGGGIESQLVCFTKDNPRSTQFNVSSIIDRPNINTTTPFSFVSRGNNAVLAYTKYDVPGSNPRLYVLRYRRGCVFESLGGVQSLSPNMDVQNVSIAMNAQGVIAVAWSGVLNGILNFYANIFQNSRWAGPTQLDLGAGFSVIGGNFGFYHPAVALDEEGNVVVVYPANMTASDGQAYRRAVVNIYR